jgi:hypothetical protein
LKNKGFKKESMTKVGLYAISKSTTLESNKSFRKKGGWVFLGLIPSRKNPKKWAYRSGKNGR